MAVVRSAVVGGTTAVLLVLILGEVFCNGGFLVFLGGKLADEGGARALRLGGIILAEEL